MINTKKYFLNVYCEFQKLKVKLLGENTVEKPDNTNLQTLVISVSQATILSKYFGKGKIIP